MAEYFDLGVNMKSFMDIIIDTEELGKVKKKSRDSKKNKLAQLRRRLMHASSYQVRPSTCVVGLSSRAVTRIKSSIAFLVIEPLAIESFHVKHPDDVKDGALLVPKVILVATHCPGRKLLDDVGDEGQLDAVYDEVCEIGADLLIIYIDLPQILYPPLKHSLYHEKITRLLFPSQPLLRSLAVQHCLLTVTENSDFNTVQRNLIRGWLSRPIRGDHPVYRAASQLQKRSACELDYWSDTERTSPSSSNQRRHLDSLASLPKRDDDDGFATVSEEHPLVEPKRFKASRRRHYGSLNRHGFENNNNNNNNSSSGFGFGGRIFGTGSRNIASEEELLLQPLRESSWDDEHELSNDFFVAQKSAVTSFLV